MWVRVMISNEGRDLLNILGRYFYVRVGKLIRECKSRHGRIG